MPWWFFRRFNGDLTSSDFKLDAELELEGFQVSSGTVRFLRRDSNGDGVLDITDAVQVLLVLFEGQSADSCRDGASRPPRRWRRPRHGRVARSGLE